MKNITTLLGFLLIANFVLGQNGQKNFIDQPYIEVSGFAETEITPDEIYLRIELSENDKGNRRRIEQQENNMLSKLRQLRIDIDKDLSVLNFSGFYRKKFLASNEVKKRKSYQLIVHDGKTMGEVFRALDNMDVSNFYILKTSHSKIEELKEENKVKALLQAKAKSESYAKALNQSIGKALYIQETSNNNYYRTVGYADLEEMVVSKSSEPIANLSLKPIKLTSNVLARFQLN